MSRQLEQIVEERTARRNLALIRALEFELVGTLKTKGIDLLGFSLKIDPFECLMTLRANVDGGRQVAFIGSDGIPNTIIKAVIAAKRDQLVWREDKYR